MIHVDDLNQYPKGEFCHMWSDADDKKELHEFAARCGIKRSWYSVSKGISGEFPHYDLKPHQRQTALNLGAKEGSMREYVTRKIMAKIDAITS